MKWCIKNLLVDTSVSAAYRRTRNSHKDNAGRWSLAGILDCMLLSHTPLAQRSTLYIGNLHPKRKRISDWDNRLHCCCYKLLYNTWTNCRSYLVHKIHIILHWTKATKLERNILMTTEHCILFKSLSQFVLLEPWAFLILPVQPPVFIWGPKSRTVRQARTCL